MTRLDAINQMLAAIGEAPVSTESSQHPDVLVAANLLDRILEAEQEPGFWFNRERDITLSVDALTNEIRVPSNTLQVDAVDETKQYVRRGEKLYDSDNSTFIFEDDVVCDLIVALDFIDLPISAQNYIASLGAYELQLSEVGDENKLTRLAQRLAVSRAAFKAACIKNGDYNARNTPSAVNMLARVRPYRR